MAWALARASALALPLLARGVHVNQDPVPPVPIFDELEAAEPESEVPDASISLDKDRTTAFKQAFDEFVSANKTFRPTFIFIAGTEGAGHHQLAKILRDKSAFPDVVFVPFPKEWGCGQWDAAGDGVKHMTDIMKFYFQLFDDPTKKTFVLPPERAYPQCRMNDQSGNGYKKADEEIKGHRNPRIDLIKIAMDYMNCDLKVMQVYKPLWQAMVSNCVHHHLSTCKEEAEILRTNAVRVVHDLRLEKQETMGCFDFTSKSTQKEALEQEFGPIPDEKFKEDIYNNEHNFDMKGIHDWPTWEEDMLGLRTADGALRGKCHELRQLHRTGHIWSLEK